MNYYNENDPRMAAWLRELIKAHLISNGVVDERSIREVTADDLKGYTQCHFFAGIGGWSYALRLAGWPDDKKAWTGSCPCQPFSQAGKGKVDSDERHLWPAFRERIAQRKPPVVFGEQVAAKDGRIWLAGVRADLEALGYAVGAADLCAAGIGAPHIRQRLFWVADSSCERRQQIARSTFGDERSNGGQPNSDNVIAGNGQDGSRLADAECDAGESGGLQSNPEKALRRRAEGHQLNLDDVATLAGWASPSSRDWKDTPGMATAGVNPDGTTRSRVDQLPRQAAQVIGQTTSSSPAQTESRGALNPAFSAWLMGYPDEWLSCADLAMPSSRKSRRSSSKPTTKH